MVFVMAFAALARIKVLIRIEVIYSAIDFRGAKDGGNDA
jgi:hypothetical protein